MAGEPPCESAREPDEATPGGTMPGKSAGTVVRKRWRWFLLGSVLLILFALPGIIWGLRYGAVRFELRNALAELDRTDPGWRFHEILQKRKAIPEDQNGAVLVRELLELLPNDWVWSYETGKELEAAPNRQVSPAAVAEVRKWFKKCDDAERRASDLSTYPEGQFSAELETASDECLMLLGVLEALKVEQRLALQEEDVERAWSTMLALKNTCAYLHDTPTYETVQIQYAASRYATYGAEVLLGQTQLSAERLKQLQDHFEMAAANQLYRTGMRYGRALGHEWLTSIENGNTSMSQAVVRQSLPGNSTWFQFAPGITDVYRAHVNMINFYNRAFAADSLQGKDRYAAIDQMHSEYRKMVLEELRPEKRLESSGLAVFDVKYHETERFLDTFLHCAQAGMAAERFRLANKRWPKSLQELVDAKLLTSIPIDLHSQNPLQFRIAADGIVIYSVGEEGDYDGSALDNQRVDSQRGIEFRLWDPQYRRQQAR